MKQYLLNEDSLPSKLPLVYSDYVTNQIENICDHNRYNANGLSALKDFIKWIGNHISNRAIAFGYGSNYTECSDEIVYIYDIGVVFCLKDDSEKVFVEIIWIDLNFEDFGLETPPNMQESKQHNTTLKRIIHLKESELRGIIDESVRMVLKEQREQRLNETINRSLRMVLKKHLV